ncbi:MAG: hypothetical protein MZV64_29600 [Ignavibacteriales bacterium]|nr:hypothetical protein [Ignavibacteriales bacterium]
MGRAPPVVPCRKPPARSEKRKSLSAPRMSIASSSERIDPSPAGLISSCAQPAR